MVQSMFAPDGEINQDTLVSWSIKLMLIFNIGKFTFHAWCFSGRRSTRTIWWIVNCGVSLPCRPPRFCIFQSWLYIIVRLFSQDEPAVNGVGDEPKPSIAPQVSQPAPIQVKISSKISSTATYVAQLKLFCCSLWLFAANQSQNT